MDAASDSFMGMVFLSSFSNSSKETGVLEK
jgi:hypothetical protein